MSEAKFTKGGWVKDYKGTIGHIKAISGFHGSLTPTVARFDVLTPSISSEEKEANAHLIATAPEMYRMLDAIASLRILPPEHVLERLLAKARGEL